LLAAVVCAGALVGWVFLRSRPGGMAVSGVQSAQEWPLHGRDASETRYSPIDQIHAGNVDQLRVAWSWRIPKEGAPLETTPIVSAGVLYGTGPMSFVFALDVRTGEEKWRWDPRIAAPEAGGPVACCGSVNRGVAVEGNKVFVGLLDGRLVALDKNEGTVSWSVQTTPVGSDYTITGAPRVAGDVVVIGNGGADFGVRGYVTAYDTATGKQVWRTYTVPGKPALGFESEAMRRAAGTWSGEWWKFGGGGTVWDAMAYDRSANLLYVGTGNGSPWSRDYRSPGGGDNLYLSSILALDARDGRMVWHFQTTPGDDWDYTATQPLMLLDLTIGGRTRNVIVQAPKNGFFYVIDRLTGQFISAQPFTTDLTWASGVDPATGRPIETPEARYGSNPDGVRLSPGPRGAHNWHPMSWSPLTGLVYIPAQNSKRLYRKSARFEYSPGGRNTGTERWDASQDRVGLKGPPTLLLAWDPARNREVWRVPADGGNGGTVATAGNLVFWGSGSRLLAIDARTGRQLWSAEVGSGPASPITYAIGGRQYVTIAAGNARMGDAPRVWTFALPAASAGRR
jgi:PQQ-dependent dehydrogenase (methanol/ethanol family)